MHADLREVEARDLLVELLRQHVDLAGLELHAGHLVLALGRVRPQRDLRDGLVGERVRHHERRVTRRAAEVHEAAAREQRDPLAAREDELIDLRLDVLLLDLLVVLEPGDLDLAVEVADVGRGSPRPSSPGSARLRITSMQPVAVTKMSAIGAAVLHRHDLVALHRRLQRADRIDLGDERRARRGRARRARSPCRRRRSRRPRRPCPRPSRRSRA